MRKSTQLSEVLERLTEQARAAGLSDSAWASRAGVRKETLSRLRSRETCDFETLAALAGAVGLSVGVVADAAKGPADRHFPASFRRDYEEQLLALCASRTLDVGRWLQLGPSFFMAGLAVLVASTPGLDRRALLDLAEQLHPGASEPEVFARWLKRSPLRPSRFLPMLDHWLHHAA